MAGGTTTGATIGFSTTSWSGIIQSATIDGEELPSIDVTGWATAGHRDLIFGKLIAPPTVEIEFITDMDDVPPITTGAAETLTITFPIPSGQTTAGTFVATGKISARSFDLPDPDESISGSMTFTCDGTTVTYTASS